jgi:hypothetical protein
VNIDLLCGHETLLHCGCNVCAKNEALEEAAKKIENMKNLDWGTWKAGPLLLIHLAAAIRDLKDKP